MADPLQLRTLLGCSLLSILLLGCNSGTQETAGPGDGVSIDDVEDLIDGSHQHAETFAEAVHEVERMVQQIEAGFADNDLEAADGPMHEIDHVLEEVVDLATKESLPQEAIAAIGAAVEQIFEGLDKVHDTIHGGEGPDYPEVKQQVDEGLEVLKRYLSDETGESTGDAEATPLADPSAG